MSKIETFDDLKNLERVIREHWRTYRPRMCAGLETQWELDESIRQAAENTRGAVRGLVDGGMDFSQAWAAVREEWAILPAEEEADDEIDGAATRDAMEAAGGASGAPYLKGERI